MNKLSLNALTAPNPTVTQQWLLRIAKDLLTRYKHVPAERTILLHVAHLAASGQYPADLGKTERGIGFAANAIRDICAYYTQQGGIFNQ
jgi:hypothetical protein